MASNSDKNWTRPWSMDEIIENSENWSLAGDVALLNTIKSFADNMLTQTATISDNVDDLLNNLKEIGLKLNISQNTFQSLRNTQFIESRVYEDDETLDSRQEVKVEEKRLSEEEKEKIIRESILEGLAVVDKYFDKIEVSISDSEEESEKSYVLQAKDLYADRPLPLIIGTEEWYKKWHVGLADSSSESETEIVSEIYSDSDSEDDLPKDMLKGSETSSELDFSSQASESRPVANSTFNDSMKKPDIFASDEESDEQGSLPVKTPISNKSFAEQLAAKLGNVISQQEDIPEEINRKPIQPAQTSKFVGDLFSDEPPPLDDLEDTILPKSAQSGLFSGGQGLFDDNEDDLFWAENKKPDDDKSFKVKPETTPSIQDTIKKATLLPKSSQVSKGLFDSDDSSDEDIFAANKKQFMKQPFLQPYKMTAPLFDEEPPQLDSQKKTGEEVTKKKPVGGVSIFGTSSLFGDQKIENILKNQQKPFTRDDNVTTDQREESIRQNVSDPTVNEKNVKPKAVSLFDDEVDNRVVTPLAKSDITVQSKKLSLFEDDDEIDDKVVEPLAKQNLTAKSKKLSLFEDDDDLFKDDLFANLTTKKLTSSLFDNQEKNEDLFETNVKNNNTSKVDLFGDLDNAKNNKKTVPNKNNMEEKPGVLDQHKPRKNLSLFSDNEEEEDIFGRESKNKKDTADVANNNSINMASENENDNLKTVEGTESYASKTTLPQRQVIGAEKRVLKDLFGSDDNENAADDLFKDVKVSKTQSKTDLFGNKIITDSKSFLTQEAASSSPPKVEKPMQEPPALQVTSPTPKASNVMTKTLEKTAISLFGSSPPPPDDDDWDTKSDNFSDNEEQFSYRADDHSGGLSLFDNEPPSLGPNESSGIVGDYNTRVDSDDSSFYPYASSSRRLSSDIYNEQQSQDNFFVTKNNTASASDTPQLGIIPEDTKSSILDITPSGDLADLDVSREHNSTTDNSVFDQNPPSKPKKPISLFDDDYSSNVDADDLFSFTNQVKNLPKLSENRLSLFNNLDDILDDKNTKRKQAASLYDIPDDNTKRKETSVESDNPNKSETVNAPVQDKSVVDVMQYPKQDSLNDIQDNMKRKETSVESDNSKKSESGNAPVEDGRLVGEVDSPKQTDSDVENKISSIAGHFKNEFDKETPKVPSGPPGRLKHNLNINVNALMPGYAPPKMRDMSKSHSLDLPKEQEATPTNLSTPDVSFVTPDLQSRLRNGARFGSEKAASFEDALDNVEVLHSVTKDRAKIPIKRKPSTRRGRRQAIRKSEVDVSLEKEDYVDPEQLNSADDETKVEENEQAAETEPVRQDLLTTTLEEAPHVFEPPSMILKKPEVNDIFDDGKDDTLFTGFQEKAGSVTEKSKSSIFDSADSDSDLFGPSNIKNARVESTAKVKTDNPSKKSLFNDSSSDDDLFSTSSSAKRKEQVVKHIEKKTQKTSMLRKLENKEADDDPLSSLLK